MKINLKILIVSDDDYVVELFQRLFERYRHRVITAATPGEGLAIVRQGLEKKNPVNLVYLDWARFDIQPGAWESSFLALDQNIIPAGLPSEFVHQFRTFFLDFKKKDPPRG